jgi:hypothetical protein
VLLPPCTLKALVFSLRDVVEQPPCTRKPTPLTTLTTTLSINGMGGRTDGFLLLLHEPEARTKRKRENGLKKEKKRLFKKKRKKAQKNLKKTAHISTHTRTSGSDVGVKQRS